VSYSSPTTSPFIVLGFLGGFVSHDEPHHPEVHVTQELRQEYPQHVYFGLFENRKVGEAYNTPQSTGCKGRRYVVNRRKVPSVHRAVRSQLGCFGRGCSVPELARAGIPVTLTIQIGSVAKPFQNDWLIPPNVLGAVNFYQTTWTDSRSPTNRPRRSGTDEHSW
jgi:hypothetical protein